MSWSPYPGSFLAGETASMSEKLHTHNKIWALALFFCALTFIAATQQNQAAKPSYTVQPKEAVTLTASLLPPSARTGDTVTLNLSFTLPKGCSLPDKPEIEGIENLSIIALKQYTGGLKLYFIADSLESIAIGPVKLSYVNEKGEKLILSSDALILKITSNMNSSPDKQQLKPIQDIILAYPLWLPWALWCALGVSLLLAAVGLFIWLRRRAAMKAQSIAAVAPHVRASSDLELLDASGLFEKGKVKEYYFRFSEILKRYLEEARGFPAAEFTTEEISLRITLDIDRELVQILKRADIVKFADDVPSPAHKSNDMKTALEYISRTTPVPETESKEVKEQ
jgi:hypothetical protein